MIMPHIYAKLNVYMNAVFIFSLGSEVLSKASKNKTNNNNNNKLYHQISKGHDSTKNKNKINDCLSV